MLHTMSSSATNTASLLSLPFYTFYVIWRSNKKRNLLLLLSLSILLLLIDISAAYLFVSSSIVKAHALVFLSIYFISKASCGNFFNKLYARISFAVSRQLTHNLVFAQLQNECVGADESIRVLNALFTTFVANAVFPSLLFYADLLPLLLVILIPLFLLSPYLVLTAPPSLSFFLKLLLFLVSLSFFLRYLISVGVSPLMKADALTQMGKVLANMELSFQDIQLFGLSSALTERVNKSSRIAAHHSADLYRSSQVTSLIVQTLLIISIFSGFSFLPSGDLSLASLALTTICATKLFYYLNRAFSAFNCLATNYRDNTSILHKYFLNDLNPPSHSKQSIPTVLSKPHPCVSIFSPYSPIADTLKFNIDGICHNILKVNGPSGSGKTTYLNKLAQDLFNSTGKLALAIPSAYGHHRNIVAASFQQNCWIDDTVLSNITLFNSNHLNYEILNQLFSSDELDSGLLLRKLSSSGLASCEVSGGQSSRCGLARAIFHEPLVLILDEPFSSVDSHRASHLKSCLFELSKSCLIIYTDHTNTTLSEQELSLSIYDLYRYDSLAG